MTKRLRAAFVYSITIEPETEPVEGNASAWGNGKGDEGDRLDREYWDSINQRLDNGELWAWCMVKVTATHPDLPDLEGVDYLGACSYENEAAFKADGYYADMCAMAADDLEAQLERVRKVVCHA